MGRRKIKLWRNFWFSFLGCFLLIIYIPFFTNFFFGTIYSLLSSKKIISIYAELVYPPEFWKPFNENWFLSKNGFILLGVLSVFLYFLFFYFHELYAEKLIIKINAYLKNLTLQKFRRLPLEEQLKQKGKISSLIERDNEVVGYHWVNFWKNWCSGLLSFGIFLSIYFYQKKFGQGDESVISNRVLFFTIFWLILMIAVIYIFHKIGYHWGKKTKHEISIEHKKINQEINNSVLINSMGLNAEWEKKQRKLTQKSNQAKVSTKRKTNLEKSIPWRLLINLFPLTLLVLEPNFIGANFMIIWNTINESVWAFGYLVNWSDYTSSRTRVNSFLNLPEREDNLKKKKIAADSMIKKISFENISFKYREQKDLMTFNQSFVIGEINYLTTPIGSGKTTKFYLLLGLLSPHSGKIIIHLQNGVSYNLHQEINLQHWREQRIAYAAHENLIETGSTGQKQWQNLETILTKRSQAQVFLFDEANNALDSTKQALLHQKLAHLAKDKVVIYISHQA